MRCLFIMCVAGPRLWIRRSVAKPLPPPTRNPPSPSLPLCATQTPPASLAPLPPRLAAPAYRPPLPHPPRLARLCLGSRRPPPPSAPQLALAAPPALGLRRAPGRSTAAALALSVGPLPTRPGQLRPAKQAAGLCE